MIYCKNIVDKTHLIRKMRFRTKIKKNHININNIEKYDNNNN